MEISLIIIFIAIFLIGRTFYFNWKNKLNIKKIYGDINIEEELKQPRHLKKMSAYNFWRIVEESRLNSSNLNQQSQKLSELLNELTVIEIVEFNNKLKELRKKAYTWDIWGVFYLINGGCSDDCFEDYRTWLVLQGKENFNEAVKDPELIVKFFNKDEDPELISHCTEDIYKSKTGRVLIPGVFYKQNKPKGNAWNEEDLEDRYPKLSKSN